jgi:DNA polymerase I-like protein with 3'-5' exonuclease and polymerase domains
LSQAEIVVAAYYSQDPLLLQVIREGKSLHDITALRTGLPRDTAKALNLMAQYGCGAERYSEHRLIPIEQGKAELKAYLASFAQRTKFFRFVMNKAQETGKVELWTGRTRHFNETVKPHSAPNNLIQGAVSECIRVATRRIAAKVPEFKMGLTVHDSILGICRTELVPQIAPEVIRLMSDWPWMNPCLTADCKAGPSWATAKKVKTHA